MTKMQETFWELPTGTNRSTDWMKTILNQWRETMFWLARL